MYTQRLYDPNHLDDSNRFQDAEGQIKPERLEMTKHDKQTLIDFITEIDFTGFYRYDSFKLKVHINIIVDDQKKQISKIYIKKQRNNKYRFSIYLKESGDYVRIANNEKIVNNDIKKTIIDKINADEKIKSIEPYFEVSIINDDPDLLEEYQKTEIYKGDKPLPLNLEVKFNTNPSQILELKIPNYIYEDDALGYFLYCARQINNNKITDVRIIEKNEGYYGKFSGFDFTKKIDQTPENSNSLSLELYKDGQKFFTVNITLKLNILNSYKKFQKITKNENKMKYLYIQYYEILFEYIKEKIPEKIKDNHDRLKKNLTANT